MDKKDKTLSEWTLGQICEKCKHLTRISEMTNRGRGCWAMDGGCPFHNTFICDMEPSEWDLTGVIADMG